MLYETRKTLLGFRLKLTFDESLNKDMSCIFVDVSKTTTVGSLLNNIVERFEIPHNSFLTVQNCKVLPSESIYVLLDLNSVKINGPSTTEVRGTRSSDVVQEENVSQKTIPLTSCNKGDVVDGKSIFPKPRPPKRPIREGIAATIRLLREEEEMERIGKECSGLSLSNDIPKESTSHQETMNVDDDKAETNLHSGECDLMSDACSDLNIEKKKRKRKRKHAKNREQVDNPSTSSSFTEPVGELRQNISNTHRKHIRFDDADDEGLDTSVDEQEQQPQQCQQTLQLQPYQQQQQLQKQERLLQQSLYHIQQIQQQQQLPHHQQLKKQNQQLALQQRLLRVQQQQQQLLLQQQVPTISQGTSNSRMSQSPVIQSTSTPNEKSTENAEYSMIEMPASMKQNQFGSSCGGIKQSGTISNLLNSQPDDKKTLDQSSMMETDDVSNAEIQSGCKNQTFQKPAKNQVQQSAYVSNATSMKPKTTYQEESYRRPKSSLSVYNGRTSSDKNTWNNSQTDSDNAGSSFINLPRLSESENTEYKPKHERVEKELATLLMCKQLDTCMEYTVQFSNEEGNGFPSKSLSSLKDVPISPINQSVVSQSNRSAQKPKTSNTNSQNIKTEGNHENGLPERMEASLDDCEFLKQVKLDGNRIRLRKSDGTWTILTPEIANAELSKLEVPKENQSIVFRIIYLNQNFIPTSSELLYGQIVTYKANTNKLAVDIPQEFVKAIVKDCGDEVLPETFVPITGSVFEIDLSALIEPKVIS